MPTKTLSALFRQRKSAEDKMKGLIRQDPEMQEHFKVFAKEMKEWSVKTELREAVKSDSLQEIIARYRFRQSDAQIVFDFVAATAINSVIGALEEIRKSD